MNILFNYEITPQKKFTLKSPPNKRVSGLTDL